MATWLLGTWLLFGLVSIAAAEAPRPNVVLILADDLGWGDLSSYGATDLATPHIDRLADEGVRFTEFYAAANTCSPSRAALMTGRYPFRSGVNAVLFHDTPEGLPHAEITIAELLRDAGYHTGMVGKWHLGPTAEFMPLRHGFDEFFGVAHSNDQENFFLWEGDQQLREPVDQSRLIERYTARAVDFLTRAVADGRPFFLYLSYTAPHVPLDPSGGFAGRSRRGPYGDVVEQLDASVGTVLDALARLGVDERTLVVFSSDNGPWLAMGEWGGSAGGLRGGKTGTFEGGHRVPALARWPGQFPKAEVDGVVTMMDWLPTFAELAGAPLPADRVVDGRTLVPLLRGSGARAATPFFYLQLRAPLIAEPGYEIGAVRDGQWKLKLPQSGYPAFLEPYVRLEFARHGRLLFDLAADPGERHDVSAAHPDVVARLERTIADFAASAAPATPVLTGGAPADMRGWRKLMQPIGVLAAVMLALAVLALAVLVWTGRRLWRGVRGGSA